MPPNLITSIITYEYDIRFFYCTSKPFMISLVVYASLAQLVEQLTLNQWVVGSNPTGGTK